MKKYPFDIFEVLREIDVKNKDYYDHDTSDTQKSFEKALQPYVIMRWLSGTNNGLQIILLNEYVNRVVFADTFLKDHKRLLFYLLTVCASGRRQRYKWTATQKNTTYPKTVECLKQYYRYSEKQARGVIPLLKVDDIVSYATDLGMQPDEIKQIQKEFK